MQGRHKFRCKALKNNMAKDRCKTMSLGDTLKKIGFEGDVCTMEVFRPDYYKLSNEENIKKAAEVTRAHVAKYWGE